MYYLYHTPLEHNTGVVMVREFRRWDSYHLFCQIFCYLPYYFLTNLASVFLPDGAPYPTPNSALSPSDKAYPAFVDFIFSLNESIIFF